MNLDSGSSSCSDEIYDWMLMDYIEESETMQVVENTIKHIVTSTSQQLTAKGLQQKKKKKRKFIERDREAANDRLIEDYFSDQPLYEDIQFRRRFRMRKHVFLRIVNTLSEHDTFFQQCPNASGRLGASALQKCTAAIRMLAYGTSADQVDEYLKLGASTAKQCLTHFVDGIVANFSSIYLRKPTAEDVHRLLLEGERRGFPGMLGSIDCMHWQWKNCPIGWKGMYQGRSKTATVILEAVASWDTWIWHAFFGVPGSNNDINVLQRSPVFDDILNERAPQVTYSVNGNTYNIGYYLTDGIYPKWAAFVDAITAPQTAKQRLFTQKQESVRKDVERAFGVLQARFAIIRYPALAWNPDILWKVMMACIILHNMIVEDERDTYKNYQDPNDFVDDRSETLAGSSREDITGPVLVSHGQFTERNLDRFLARRDQLRNKQMHMSLKNDLVEHIWRKCQKSNLDQN